LKEIIPITIIPIIYRYQARIKIRRMSSNGKLFNVHAADILFFLCQSKCLLRTYLLHSQSHHVSLALYLPY